MADGIASSAKSGSGLRQRALGPLQGLLWALKPLMRGALRKTTLLLMFIWFTNALCYYGLVLLTTSVCLPSTLQNLCCLLLPVMNTLWPLPSLQVYTGHVTLPYMARLTVGCLTDPALTCTCLLRRLAPRCSVCKDL